MAATKREEVLKVIAGETPEIIPTIAEGFMDVTVARALGNFPTGDGLKDEIALTELVKKNDLTVGTNMNPRTIEQTSDHRIYEYEGGAQWIEKYKPTFCREAIKYPVNQPEDIGNLKLPDYHDPSRYEGMERAIRDRREAGYFVQGCTGGIWLGSYYFCTSFDNILTWMAMEAEAAHLIFNKVGTCVLAAAEEMLKRGVDSVFIYDDLGSGQSLLYSKEMYREFIKPWHKKLAELCHSYGKYFHMHSHGHIQDVMDDLVDVGVDILNPVGPSDHNDLVLFKQKWGGKITFLGGISTTIASMTEDQIEQHVASVMEAGCKGGRFMPRTESGIPMMEPGKAKFFIDTLYRYRVQHGKA